MKSKHTIKNHVRFKGEFKKEFKDEFPGRDLAEFIAEQLRQKNYVVNSVEYEEPWFTVNVVSGSIEYPLMVSHSAMEDDYWEISCPRTLGFFARLRGKSEDTELQNLVNTLDEILQDEKTITDIKWFSDYSDLTDDYVQRPVAKRLSVVEKYFGKLFLPLCATGMILLIIGSIRDYEKSPLVPIGTIMFLLPFALFFGFIALNFLVALIYDIKDSHRKKSKKKWLRWFVYFAIIAMLVVPFFLGLLRIPSIDKVMPSIFRGFLSLAVLVMFGGILFIFGTQLFISFSRIFFPGHSKKRRPKEPFFLVGSLLVLLGVTGFFGGCLSSLGVLKWVPNSFEFPLALVNDIDVNRNGDLFVLVQFYGRIQVYDTKGDFVRGWFFYAPSGKVQMKINDQNEIEVAAFSSDKIYLFNENGKLLKTNTYEDMYSRYPSEDNTKHLFNESTGLKYDVEGLVFPKIIQTGLEGEKKIGKNAVYLFPFQGPFHAVAMGMFGMYLMNLAEKKKKKKHS